MGVSTGVNSILARCASNVALDAEVRVAALDAYRRMPCHADDVSRQGHIMFYDYVIQIQVIGVPGVP